MRLPVTLLPKLTSTKTLFCLHLHNSCNDIVVSTRFCNMAKHLALFTIFFISCPLLLACSPSVSDFTTVVTFMLLFLIYLCLILFILAIIISVIFWDQSLFACFQESFTLSTLCHSIHILELLLLEVYCESFGAHINELLSYH